MRSSRGAAIFVARANELLQTAQIIKRRLEDVRKMFKENIEMSFARL